MTRQRDEVPSTHILAAMLRRVMRSISGSTAALREFIRVMSRLHLFVYRVTGGVAGGRYGLPNGRFVLLTTTGRKTGKPHTVPLLSIDDSDAVVVIASHGGLDQPPAWWLNLRANPNAHLQIGRRVLSVTAHEADPGERSRLWPLFVAEYSGYLDYQQRTSRELPIMVLRPVGNAARTSS